MGFTYRCICKVDIHRLYRVSIRLDLQLEAHRLVVGLVRCIEVQGDAKWTYKVN